VKVRRIGIVVLVCLVQLAGDARGDGGTVRLSERAGVYLLTVFTAPTPLRAGPVDISVLVQDARTGRPASVDEVVLRLHQSGERDGALQQAATREQATDRLLHAAKFDLPAAGRWQAEVCVRGPGGEVVRMFEFQAGEPLPRWAELWVWIFLPVVPVVLFLVHQALRGRNRERRSGR
jgi:hypothetical protein